MLSLCPCKRALLQLLFRGWLTPKNGCYSSLARRTATFRVVSRAASSKGEALKGISVELFPTREGGWEPQKLRSGISSCSHEETCKRALLQLLFRGWLTPKNGCYSSLARRTATFRVVSRAASSKGEALKGISVELFHHLQRPQQVGKALVLPSATRGNIAAERGRARTQLQS